MKKYVSYLLVLVMLVMFAEDATAQRKKRRKSRDKKEEAKDEMRKPFSQNLVYEIGFGNPSFLGGGGSASFNIALKPGVGYKFHDRITAGTFAKWDYLFLNENGREFSLHHYGFGLFGRFKVIDAFYLRAEYAFASYPYETTPNGIIIDREYFLEPLLGAGYRSGYGTWVFGGEVLFHLNKDLRDYISQVIEFWFKVDYNF